MTTALQTVVQLAYSLKAISVRTVEKNFAESVWKVSNR